MDTTTTLTLENLTPTEAAFAGGLIGTFTVFGIIVLALVIIGIWKIFTKAGEKGWKSIIPIYNMYILFKICGATKWFWGLLCASILGSILMTVNMPKELLNVDATEIDYSIIEWGNYPAYTIGLVIACIAGIVEDVIIAVRLAKAFGKGIGYTLGIIFLPYVFTIILGFGSAKYNKKAVKA